MEEIRSSPPPAASNTMRKQETSATSRMKKDCLWFAASMQEGFGYAKAGFIGLQTKKLTARNEKEATEADLLAAKMQVEAADAAEEAKKRLDKTM
ncbi:uncharacterized protein LOC133871995 isoform X2 [Alnus glutinosa]|uniref:uncharacterized protein LOC133871995 isoform X2 n=1 Tax=Alnus glutinosa TaxID=3517 RepID=UPI002D786652|nr:uncharacterized protein LOC133871995 isoform X2 [Alnus glutinosa]